MRSLFLHQAEERIIDEIPWCNYDPNAASRPKQNFKSLIRTNVDPTTLTDGQCQALLTPIAKAIQRGTVSGLDIALLLRLILLCVGHHALYRSPASRDARPSMG